MKRAASPIIALLIFANIEIRQNLHKFYTEKKFLKKLLTLALCSAKIKPT